jgi:hypothetical protein
MEINRRVVRRQLKRPILPLFSNGRKQLRIYLGLALRICDHGLEGFGVSMLPFAALKLSLHNSSARWGIGIPAFFAIMVPVLRQIFPWCDETMQSWKDDAEDAVEDYSTMLGLLEEMKYWRRTLSIISRTPARRW